MATKKIQKLIQSKVGAHSNLTIPFSRQKQKIVSKEKPFFFENLESDKDDNDTDDLSTKSFKKKNICSDTDENRTTCNSEASKSNKDEYNQCEASTSCGSAALRTRVGSFGKSVNSAIKDAHSAINSIMKESVTKKVSRKSIEVTRRKRVRSFVQEERETRIIEKEEENDDEKIGVKECTIIGDCGATEFGLGQIDGMVLGDETLNTCDIIEPTAVNVTEDVMSYHHNASNDEVMQQVDLVNMKILTAVGSLIFILLLFSISNFIMGLLCGVLMSFGTFKIYESFFSSVTNVPQNSQIYSKLRDKTSSIIPLIEDEPLIDQYATPKASFSAWVDAVNSYHQKSHKSELAYSLHLSFEGTKLLLRKPKDDVSSTTAEYETEIKTLEFVEERTIELLHAKVYLLPRGLVRRRMWSKRYPICMTIIKNEDDKSVRMVASASKSDDSVLNPGADSFFFFARTCRDKEEIFRRLMAASLGMPINLSIAQIVAKYLSKEVLLDQAVPLAHVQDTKEGETTGKVKEEGCFVKQRGVPKVAANTKEPQIVTYVRYMAKFMSSNNLIHTDKNNPIDLNYTSCESELLWINALLGRVAWDVFRGGHWIKVIREKIQKKLNKIHLPYFIDQLEIIDIDLGLELPVIKKVGRPYLNYRGLWVEFEVVYDGGFSMGLETKMNLMKLKNVANQHRSTLPKCKKSEFSVKYQSETGSAQAEHSELHDDDFELDGAGAVMTDDCEAKRDSSLNSDDSLASTSESELSGDKSQDLSHASSNKSFLKWVDKFAKSSYFQKAADTKFVQRTLELVSNTSLQLQVDAMYLNGTLVINIPPPPSDRLWWGFKKSPQLNIKARPKVGQKEIQMTKLVEFIEKKLLQEFHRAVVLPNMDDVTLPLLFSDEPAMYGHASS